MSRNFVSIDMQIIPQQPIYTCVLINSKISFIVKHPVGGNCLKRHVAAASIFRSQRAQSVCLLVYGLYRFKQYSRPVTSLLTPSWFGPAHSRGHGARALHAHTVARPQSATSSAKRMHPMTRP